MTDVLHCKLLHVGGRVYRDYSNGVSRSYEPLEEDPGEDAGFWDEDGAIEGEDEGIEPDGDGFKAVISLDSELFGFLIGQRGATKQRIEQDTGCQIHIPRRDSQPQQQRGTASAGGSVTVRGSSRAAVARAKTQVQLLVASALSGRRLDYNYFLSLPLATEATSSKLAAWREAVLAEPSSAAAGIEPSIFTHEKHLHLTLVMLKLYSDEARAVAAATLRGLQAAVQQLLQEGPLRVQLKGLEYMNDEPGAMHVLYLGVRDGAPGALDRLQRLCSLVVEAFASAGLVQPQDDRPVKLHATVINTRYRKRGSAGESTGGSGQGQQLQQDSRRGGSGRARDAQRQAFDGQELLARHRDLDLGVLDLLAVHLSQRGKYDQQTGFYSCAAALPLTS